MISTASGVPPRRLNDAFTSCPGLSWSAEDAFPSTTTFVPGATCSVAAGSSFRWMVTRSFDASCTFPSRSKLFFPSNSGCFTSAERAF